MHMRGARRRGDRESPPFILPSASCTHPARPAPRSGLLLALALRWRSGSSGLHGVLPGRLARGGRQPQPMAQALPRWLSVKAVSGVGGAALLVVGASWAWPSTTLPRLGGEVSSRRVTEGVGIRGVSTAAEDEASHTAGECDCAPLWACMQAGNGGCEMLDKQLRACLARQKLHATRNGETVHSA